MRSDIARRRGLEESDDSEVCPARTWPSSSATSIDSTPCSRWNCCRRGPGSAGSGPRRGRRDAARAPAGRRRGVRRRGRGARAGHATTTRRPSSTSSRTRIGMPEGAWIHYGLTSSDVVDTALCFTLAQAMDIVINEATALRDALTRRAVESIDWPITGRTHGMHAEPTTFGAKFALFALQVAARPRARAAGRERRIAVGKLSGRGGHLLQHRSRRRGVRLRDASASRPFPATQVDRARPSRRGALRLRVAGHIDRIRSPSRCATSRAARSGRPRSPSPRARRGRRRCRTSATPCSPSASAAWRGCCAATCWRASRTSRSGTSATSRTRASSAWCCPTRCASRSTCCARPAASPTVSCCTASGRWRISPTAPTVWSSPSRSCSPSSNSGMSRDDAYRVVQARSSVARDERRNLREVVEADDDVSARRRDPRQGLRPHAPARAPWSVPRRPNVAFVSTRPRARLHG